MLHIAVLGAPRSGKSWLAGELARALAARPVSVSDGAALLAALTGPQPPAPRELEALARAHGRRFDMTLLMGLDLAPTAQDRSTRAVDAALRDTLDRAGLAYKVIYGRGTQRLEHALLAVEAAAPAARLATQYGLQGGRVAWRCENCSDPDCEHRLFTGLLR